VDEAWRAAEEVDNRFPMPIVLIDKHPPCSWMSDQGIGISDKWVQVHEELTEPWVLNRSKGEI
jgi:hypothetical protein